MKIAWNPSRAAFYALLLGLFAAILLMARANGLTFPVPNEDGARFFLPAWNLAVHGNLNAPVLNAPNGIYWVPHGYYVWVAAFLSLFGPTMRVAQQVSQVTTAAAAVIFTLANARISRSRLFAGLSALLLISPAVIFTANTVRQESLVFLLYALAMLLHSYRRYILAAAMMALSLLVHPALLMSTGLYLAAIAFLCFSKGSGSYWRSLGRSKWIRATDVAVVLIVLAAMAAEAILVGRHMDLFRQHMGFQIERKAGRNLLVILTNRRGVILSAEVLMAAFSWFALSRYGQIARIVLEELGPIVLVALGLQAYAAMGYEGQYAVYSYAIVPVTLLCAAYGAVSMLSKLVPKTSEETVALHQP